MPRIAIALITLLLTDCRTVTVSAEQSKTFGEYTIHYVAFTTDLLSPEVARLYKIRRSKNRAILNISVLKKVMETTGQPVKAQVEATATNLTQAVKKPECPGIK